MNIYVSNLSFHTTSEDLKTLFSKFGEVTSAKVIMDKMTDRSRGFGFVEMSSEENGKEAMTALNNKEIERKRRVLEARIASLQEEFESMRDVLNKTFEKEDYQNEILAKKRAEISNSIKKSNGKDKRK